MPVLETIQGYEVALSEPDSTSGSWRVVNPGGMDYDCQTGYVFWSVSYSTPFRLLNHLGAGVWNIEWIPFFNNPTPLYTSGNTLDINVPEFSIFADEPIQEELTSEFSDYVLNEPFLYMNRWSVVMEDNMFRVYDLNQVWYSEREGSEFRLGAQLRPDLFGSHNSFRIDWIDPEEYREEDDSYYEDDYSQEHEEIDVREVAPVIATNIGRSVPYVSFEQEFSGNGDIVARKLYDAGFSASRHVEGYHSSDGRITTHETDRFCYVETDSSCGYELIFDRMQLNQRIEAEKISAVQTILRNLKNEGVISLSARCGFHVHVDVSDWGMKEIVSGYHLWNYLEDPVFRFASAFWNMHRDEEVGGGYSTPVPKGHLGRKDIGTVLGNRRDSLNFSPILAARGNCVCNASFYEDWANCTCNIRQPTLEFRVFNATINQRKIRAYLAFCVAFVNMAKSEEFEPATFPEMRWSGTEVKPMLNGTTWEKASLERIKFILEKFPLTNAEKTDIVYCLRNSSLQTVVELL